MHDESGKKERDEPLSWFVKEPRRGFIYIPYHRTVPHLCHKAIIKAIGFVAVLRLGIHASICTAGTPFVLLAA